MGVFATFRPSSPSDASPSIHLPGIKCSDDDRETRQHRKAVENGEGLPPHTPSGTHHTAARRPQPPAQQPNQESQRAETQNNTANKRAHSASLAFALLTDSHPLNYIFSHPPTQPCVACALSFSFQNRLFSFFLLLFLSSRFGLFPLPQDQAKQQARLLHRGLHRDHLLTRFRSPVPTTTTSTRKKN